MFGIWRRGKHTVRQRGAMPKAGRVPPRASQTVDLGPLDDLLGRSDRAVVDVPGRAMKLLIVSRRGELFAFQATCPHMGRPLDDAVISSAGVTCRGHGLCFDLRTGASRRSPGGLSSRLGRPRLGVYPAWIDQGRLRVQVPDSALMS
jgi:nitrite reductase/ring-hydroxylating ferredoxin subunit